MRGAEVKRKQIEAAAEEARLEHFHWAVRVSRGEIQVEPDIYENAMEFLAARTTPEAPVTIQLIANIEPLFLIAHSIRRLKDGVGVIAPISFRCMPTQRPALCEH